MDANNPFQIKFTLRQQTPIIHFQWHEKDASIRPTELKAKLDKWIIASMTGCYGNEDARMTACENFTQIVNGVQERNLWKWLRGAKKADKTNPALNYSVRVIPVGENTFEGVMNETIGQDNHGNPKLNNTDFPTYFGNQMKIKRIPAQGGFDNQEEYRNGKKRIKRLTFHKGVQVIIISPYSDLIDKIKEVFPEFILKTNFGTRQGKGFGSFFIEKGTTGFPHNHQDWFIGKFDWKFDVEVSGNEQAKIKDLFTKIDLLYKTLRSGINLRDRNRNQIIYYKSLMFQYVKDKLGKQWDKKTIKKKYFLNSSMSTPQNEATQKTNPNYLSRTGFPKDPESPLFWEGDANQEKFLWRDLLGLSSEQQWLGYTPNRVVKKHFPAGNETEITRFKSPIFFKPIRTGVNTFRVYFEVPKHIKQAFSNDAERNLAEEAAILGEEIKISTTSPVPGASWGLKFPDTFDFDAFIKFAISRHPKNQVHNTGHHNTSAYEDLLKIKVTKA